MFAKVSSSVGIEYMLLVFTPLFQSNFPLVFVQVNVLVPEVFFSPFNVHFAPDLIAAFDGDKIVVDIKAVNKAITKVRRIGKA